MVVWHTLQAFAFAWRESAHLHLRCHRMTAILSAKWQGLATGTNGCLTRIDADQMSSLDIIISDAIIAPFPRCYCADSVSARCNSGGNVLPRFSARRRMPLHAVALKQYRSSAALIGSKMSDKKDTSAALWNSEVFST